MRMLKTQLIHDLVFIVEPTIRTKVAWARPERAGRKANSKSTCEVQDLRTANALRKRQPSVPFSAMPPRFYIFDLIPRPEKKSPALLRASAAMAARARTLTAVGEPQACLLAKSNRRLLNAL